MKKSLAFIAIVALAAVSQAATISWKSGTMYVPLEDGTPSGVKIGAAASATILLVSADTYNTYSAMSSQEIYDDYVGGKITSTETATGASTKLTNAANVSTKTDFAKGSTAYAIAIYTTEANDKTYFITATGYDTINDFGDPSGAGSVNLAAGKSWTPVPEPCSVALLALGLAAFGLKRKVA